jgi:hypothetical protein
MPRIWRTQFGHSKKGGVVCVLSRRIPPSYPPPSTCACGITPSTPHLIFNESHIGAAVYSQTQTLKISIWKGVFL